MNWETDELLDMVDKWKLKLHDTLKKMSKEERAEFWKKSRERIRALGFAIDEPKENRQSRPKPKKQRRTA